MAAIARTRHLFRSLPTRDLLQRASCSTASTIEFHDSRVQGYISRINGMDFNKVFAERPGEESLPQFRLLSENLVKNEYDKIKEECIRLLTPPTMSSTVREDGGHAISRDILLDGFDDSKWVFTDISMDTDDNDRYIVVREPEGTLRQATATERDRLCQTFMPKPGRKIWLQNLLTEQELPSVLRRQNHVHVLDVVCVQCPPNSPDYVRVHETVYADICKRGLYSLLYSTRYYGGLVWYLIKNDNVEGIMTFIIENGRLEEMEALVQLYILLHPEVNIHFKNLSGELLIKEFCAFKNYTQLLELLPTKASEIADTAK